MPSLRIKVGIVCAITAFAVGGVAWWNATRPTAENDPVGFSVALAERAIAGIPTVPIESIEALRAGLSAAPIEGKELIPGGVAREIIDDLREYVAAMLHTRFADPGPEAYIKLQQGRGRRFLTVGEFPTGPGASLDAIASYWLGEPAKAGTTPESLFRSIWDVSLDIAGGRNRVVGAAVADGGMAIALGRLEHADMPSSERLHGRLPAAVWYGSISHTCGRWMVPPNSKTALIERYGPLLSASVGVVIECARGPRRPMVLRYYWDPELSLWQFDAATINNYDPPAGVNPCPVF